MKIKNRIGKRYGRLTVLAQAPSKAYGEKRQKFSMWECQCDCGKIVVVRGGSLQDSNTLSCGCVHRERLVQCATKHGYARSPFNNIYQGMMQRCYNPKSGCYHSYGKRGIRVCKRWHKFENFLKDMIGGFRLGLTLERENVNKGYNPENCRWATWGEQALNRRSTRWIEYRGKRKPLAVWAREANLKPSIIVNRINRGWPLGRALTLPIQKIFAPRAPRIAATP